MGRYDYDAGLQRIRRRTQSERVEYVLDGAFVLQEADASLAGYPTRRRYHYGEGPLAVTDTPRAVALADGLAGATTNFLSTDALGSVSDVTSGTGEVVTARKYDAWGSYRDGTAPGAGDFKLGYTGHQYDVETGLTYARARYYDSELGRFISRDSYEGQFSDAPSLHRYVYAHGNPLSYRDEDGHSATAIGAVAGFFWGAGQMATAMGRDLMDGRTRDPSDYLSLWAQNIIGGAEIGASIDLTIASGGTLALAGSGALGGAGFNALTFDGEAKSWSEFAAEQKHGAAWGAAGGVVLGKVAPVLAKVPIVKQAVEKVGELGTKLVGRYVASAGDELVTAAPNVFKELGVGFGDDLGRTVAEGFQQGAAETVNGGSVAAPEFPVGGWTPASASIDEAALWRETFRVLRDKVEAAEAGRLEASLPGSTTIYEGAMSPTGQVFVRTSGYPAATAFRLPAASLERFPPGVCAMPRAAEAAKACMEGSGGSGNIVTTRGGFGYFSKPGRAPHYYFKSTCRNCDKIYELNPGLLPTESLPPGVPGDMEPNTWVPFIPPEGW